MMLKFVLLQRGCSWVHAWQEHCHGQQHGDREGSDIATTQNFTGSLSESRELCWV